MTPDRVETPVSVDALAHLGSALGELRTAVDAIDEDAPLVELAALAEKLDELLAAGKQAREALHLPLAAHMGDKVVREGQLELECRQGAKRRAWQSIELLGQLARLARFDPETGDELADDEAFRRLHALVSTCVPVTPSLGWRSGGLRDAGLDPDEFCEWAPGRVTVLVRRIDPDGVVETEDAA